MPQQRGNPSLPGSVAEGEGESDGRKERLEGETIGESRNDNDGGGPGEECESIVYEPWRLAVPDCECPMNSRHCKSSLATQEDLFKAAKEGNMAVLTWYMDREVDETLSLRDSFGRTITHYLVELEDTKPICEVIRRCEDIVHLDRAEKNRWGRTQVMIAVESGNLEMVKVLVAERVRLRSKSEEGKRVPDYAAKHPHIQDFFDNLVSGKEERGRSIIDSRNRYGGDPVTGSKVTSPRGHSSPNRASTGGVILLTGDEGGGGGHGHYGFAHSHSHQLRRASTWNAAETQQLEEAKRKKLKMKKRGNRLISDLPHTPQAKSEMHALTVKRGVSDGEKLVDIGIDTIRLDMTGRAEYFEECQRTGAKVRNSVMKQLSGEGLLSLKGEASRDDALPISAAIRGSRYITRIFLEECNFGDFGAASLISAFASSKSRISKLSLIRCGLKGTAAAALAAAINNMHLSSLAFLTLDSNDLSDAGVEALASSFADLGDKSPPLASLSLSRCGVNGGGRKGVDALRRMLLSPHVPLEDLDISWNSIGPRAAAKLITAAGSKTSIKTLSLAFNRIGAQGVASLQEAISVSTTLERIDLTCCGLTPADASPIASAFASARALKIVKIDQNDFGYDGGLDLANAMQANGIQYCLTEGHITAGSGGLHLGAGEQMVSSFSEHNPSGRFRLLLSEPRHRDVAEKLVNQAEMFDGEAWRNETFNGERFSFQHGYVLPQTGQLCLDCVHLEPNDPEQYGKMEESDFVGLCKVLNNQRSSSSRLALIRKMTSQYTFTAEQVSELLFIIPPDSGDERICAATSLVPRIIDRDEAMYMALSPLSLESKEELCRRMGPSLFFDGIRCAKFGFCHNYHLDLSKALDHRFLTRLVDMCKEDRASHRFTVASFNSGGFSGPWNLAMYSVAQFDAAAKTLVGARMKGVPAWEYDRAAGRIKQLPGQGTLVVRWEYQGASETPNQDDDDDDDDDSFKLRMVPNLRSMGRQMRSQNLADLVAAQEPEEDPRAEYARKHMAPGFFARNPSTTQALTSLDAAIFVEALVEGADDKFAAVIPQNSKMANHLRRMSGSSPFSALATSRVPLVRPRRSSTASGDSSLASLNIEAGNGSPAGNGSGSGSFRRPHTTRDRTKKIDAIRRVSVSAASKIMGLIKRPEAPKTAPGVGTTFPLEPFPDARVRDGLWTVTGGGDTSRPATGGGIFFTPAKVMKFEQAKKLDLDDKEAVRKVLVEIVEGYKQSKLADRSAGGGKAGNTRGGHRAPNLSVKNAEKSKRWQCPVCRMHFVQEDNLMFHIEKMHLADDLGRADHRQRMEVMLRCEEVEERLSALDELIASERQSGKLSAASKKEAEDFEFVGQVDNYDFEEPSDESESESNEEEEEGGHHGHSSAHHHARPEWLGPKKKRDNQANMSRPITSFSELSFDPHEAEWKFAPEQRQAEIEIMENNELESKALQQPTKSLEQVLIKKRYDLLRKYRDGPAGAAKVLPTKATPRVRAASTLWKRAGAATGMHTVESMAQENRRITQERHFDMLGWMDN